MASDQSIDLCGARVLVTGGTSGLGLAMASALTRVGATVVLTSRSAERAGITAAQLPGATGVVADARDEASVARAVGQVCSHFGGIDLLVNNAGLGMKTVNPRFMVEPRGFWEVPVHAFRAVIETNLTGHFLMAREIRCAQRSPGTRRRAVRRAAGRADGRPASSPPATRTFGGGWSFSPRSPGPGVIPGRR